MKMQSLFSILLGIILLSPGVSVFSESLTESDEIFSQGRSPTIYKNPEMNYTFTPGDFVILSGAELGEEFRAEMENDSEFDSATLNWYTNMNLEIQADGPCEIQTVMENCHIRTMDMAFNITAYNNSENTKMIINISFESDIYDLVTYSGWSLEDSKTIANMWYGPQDGAPFYITKSWENETIESNETGVPAEIILGDNWTESDHSYIEYQSHTEFWIDPTMGGSGNETEDEAEWTEEWTNFTREAIQEITVNFDGYNEADTSGSGPSSLIGMKVQSWIKHDNGTSEFDDVFVVTDYGLPIQIMNASILTYKYQAEFSGVTDSDTDGVMNSADLCPNTEAEAEVDQNGCSWDQRDDDGDGVANSDDQCEGYDDAIDTNSNGIPDDCDNKAPFAKFFAYGNNAYPGELTDLEPWVSGDEQWPAYQVKFDVIGVAVVGFDACDSFDPDTYNNETNTGEKGLSAYNWKVYYDERFDIEVPREDPNIYQTNNCDWSYTFKNITADESNELINYIKVQLSVVDEFGISSDSIETHIVIVPDNWHDADRDGVDDADDLCPGYNDDIDIDNDGIPDGCDPFLDRDNDGVSDEDDQCNGYDDSIDVDADGKPDDCDVLIDSDGDMVADFDDVCDGFDDAVDIDFDDIPDGCDDIVDKDGDGIAFFNDFCLWTPGGEVADERGCSDSQLDDDNDNVTNDLDQCLNIEAGTFDSDGDGCPDDSDSDGIIDSMDSCINKAAGSIDSDNDGCPDDSDGDGISDENDDCPLEKVCKTSDSSQSGLFGQSNSIVAGGIGVIILLLLSVLAINFAKGKAGEDLQDPDSQLFAQPSAPSPEAQGSMKDGIEVLEHPADSGTWYYRDQSTGQWAEWR
ncbi:MAG: hypothetical protein CXT71_05265 [Methanobacteriota archaeon]|jgi:hypothetical protein|nr:MAG: hypothetical protein CXT71_05265 [Euryarchaeota archaeon]